MLICITKLFKSTIEGFKCITKLFKSVIESFKCIKTEFMSTKILLQNSKVSKYLDLALVCLKKTLRD